MSRHKFVSGLCLLFAFVSCTGPVSPSPVVVTRVTPTVTLEVREATCCNRSGVAPIFLPTISYSVCFSLSISAAEFITYTQYLTVFGEDGTAYFTRAFDNEQTLRRGIVRVGCAGAVTDHDLSRTGYSYTYRIDYRTDDGTAGSTEGTAPYRQLVPFRTGIVISQFRPRGPNGPDDQFVELTNVTAAPIDIDDWWLQGSSSVSSVGTINSLSGAVPPGCSVLVATSPPQRTGGPGYSGSVRGNIPIGPFMNDAIGIAVLTGAGQIVDQVAMSANTFYKEGTPLDPFGAANTDRAYVRVADTGDNRRDFQMRSPSAPRNLSMCSRQSLVIGPANQYAVP